MSKIAIFGGTFDPIHIGHIHIAYSALYALNLNKIVFMPTGIPPHKRDRKITDTYIRYEMVKMLTREEPSFEVSSYEVEKNTLSYTYETLEHFKKKYPHDELFFLTGSDCLMDLDGWKNVKEIFSFCTFVVFSRPGVDKASLFKQKEYIEKKYSGKIIFLEVPMLQISSTDIREKIRLGENVSYLIPFGVHGLIEELKLYK